MNDLLIDGPQAPKFVFAHGAGAPMDSDFMQQFTELLVERGIGVVRFEFPYMAQRRTGGSKRPPNRQPELLACWRELLASMGDLSKTVIGGKSMGGRMASLIADEIKPAGLVCLGYPFHPAKKPETTRTEHLSGLDTDTLIVQGTRDPLGNREEVLGYDLSHRIALCWLEDGDHDLKPRKKSGFDHQQHLITAADRVAEFIRKVTG